MSPLIRYFSIVGVMAIAIATLVQAYLLQSVERAHLVHLGEQNNVALTQTFANAMWAQDFAPLMSVAAQLPDRALKEHADVLRIQQKIRQLAARTAVAKVKVFDMAGRTMFSTETAQIGENKSTSPSFLAARGGGVASELSFREKFAGMHGDINRRDLLSSYVPVFAADGKQVTGVFEVYVDITDLTAEIRHATQTTVLIVAGTLSALFIVLFLAVRRADRRLAKERRVQRDRAQRLIRARDKLERRVQERTAELQKVNHDLHAEIKERREVERRITHMALHDALTGLPNRAYLTERITESIATANRDHHKTALLFLDLDNFKHVNDTLGHGVGDRLLRLVAHRLSETLRKGDAIARFGGDEFVVHVPVVDDLAHITQLAERLQALFVQPIAMEGRLFPLGVSIGISIYPDDAASTEDMMRHADLAMYEAKAGGRGQFRYFTFDATSGTS